jgi:hypothetical protein
MGFKDEFSSLSFSHIGSASSRKLMSVTGLKR